MKKMLFILVFTIFSSNVYARLKDDFYQPLEGLEAIPDNRLTTDIPVGAMDPEVIDKANEIINNLSLTNSNDNPQGTIEKPKWNDNIGDILATSLGVAVAIPIAIITINPWATFVAGTAGASITYTTWNYVYNKYIPKKWK